MYSKLALAAWSALLVSAGVVRKDPEVKTGLVTIPSVESPLATDWDCEVRAWTRAPDLSPNAAVPAEARLALNGSACSDIIGWKAGLRFKERAIVKLQRNDTGQFPSEPKWQRPNTSIAAKHDWNDILSPDTFMYSSSDSDGYGSRQKAYQEALRREDLWNIHGAEKDVFDTQLGLELPADLSVPQDLIHTFIVHMPNTNFPPVEAHPYMRSQNGKNSQMMNAEQLFEFYHSLELRNGTTLDVPAGLVGFLPAAQPVMASRSATAADKMFPAVVSLQPPAPPGKCEGMGGFPTFHYPTPNGCDNTTVNHFGIKVTPKADFVQGKNVTLDLVITRTGNGTEYPSFLDVRLRVNKTLSWAHQFMAPLSEAEVFNDPCRWGEFRPREFEMRMAPLIEDMKRERAEREAQDGQVVRLFDGTWLGKYGVRHDFDEEGDATRTEYRLELELPIPRQTYPAFQTTFEDITNSLSFELATESGCNANKSPQDEDKNELSRDDEWKEYVLPPTTKTKKSKPRRARRDPKYKGALTVYVGRPPGLSESVVHYMDSGALAPVLSADHVQHDAFPLVKQVIRSETKEELRKSRFDRSGGPAGRCGSGQPVPGSDTERCWRRNHGGAGTDAAKMWQAKVELAKSGGQKHRDGGHSDDDLPQAFFEFGEELIGFL